MMKRILQGLKLFLRAWETILWGWEMIQQGWETILWGWETILWGWETILWGWETIPQGSETFKDSAPIWMVSRVASPQPLLCNLQRLKCQNSPSKMIPVKNLMIGQNPTYKFACEHKDLPFFPSCGQL